MRFSSTPETNILLAAIAMMCPPKKDCSASADAWMLDVARQQADFAALIDAEGDLAEVHVVQLPVERDRVAADGGNGAPLGLPRIEVRRGEDDLVADAPAGGVQHLDRGAAGARRCWTAWSRCCCRSPCRFSVPPMSMMPRSPMPCHESSSGTLLVRVIVALRVWGLASVPICQLPVQHDPLGGQLEVGLSSAKLSLPSIVRPSQRRRADVEDDVLVLGDGDLVACGWHLAVRPGGRIGPARRLGRRPAFWACRTANAPTSRMPEGAQPEGTSDGHLLTNNLRTRRCREPQRHSVARSGAQQNLNPVRIADFRRSRLPPPQFRGDGPLNRQIMGPGCWLRQRVSGMGANPLA